VVPNPRPPLSKRCLRGEIEADGTFVAPEGFYREQDVELRLDTAVRRVRAGERVLELRGGERLPFDRLVVAAGGTPRTLGVPGEDLEGVFRLRTLSDSSAIREAARSARRAVVIGGSFIGSEVAASLRTLGLDVTLVHRGTGIFDVLGSTELSGHLADLYRSRGVELVFGDQASEFAGNGRLERVLTKQGRDRPAAPDRALVVRELLGDAPRDLPRRRRPRPVARRELLLGGLRLELPGLRRQRRLLRRHHPQVVCGGHRGRALRRRAGAPQGGAHVRARRRRRGRAEGADRAARPDRRGDGALLAVFAPRTDGAQAYRWRRDGNPGVT